MTEYKNITDLCLSELTSEGIDFEKNLPLSRVSSFRTGGPCDLALMPESISGLEKAVNILRGAGIPYAVVGRTTDLLFDDAGFRGALIFTSGVKEVSCNGTLITAGCGLPLSSLARLAAENGLSGLEFAYGIPGSTGGGVYMNAGAYGGQLSQVIKSVRIYNGETRESFVLSGNEMEFSYRHSLLCSHPEYTVCAATFELTPADSSAILAAEDEFMRRRREKQPLEYPSAGSVFKRPKPDVYMGKLIEEAGLKGYSIGGAQVSEKHAGFIINRNNATSADVLALIRFVQDKICELHGFVPECEIIRVPENPADFLR